MPVAKWPAHCSLCDTGIRRGDSINKYGNKWVHSECNRIRAGTGFDANIVSSGTMSSVSASVSSVSASTVSPDVSPGCKVSYPGDLWLAAKSIYPQAYCKLRLVTKSDGWCFEREKPVLREPATVSRDGWMPVSARLAGFRVSQSVAVAEENMLMARCL